MAINQLKEKWHGQGTDTHRGNQAPKAAGSVMLRLLRNVRRAIKQWRALPSGERERYRDHVDRIRSLVAELGGRGAVSYIDGTSDAHADMHEQNLSADRPRAEVIAELHRETSSLLTALAGPAAALAHESVPRSAKIGGKLAGKGIRGVARRIGER